MARTFDAVDEMGKVVTGAAIIGASVPRIDGPLKTTGTAQYAADFHFANMVHAVPVLSTIASGKIVKIDAAKAEQMPGVLLVLHSGNIGKLYRTVPGMATRRIVKYGRRLRMMSFATGGSMWRW